MYRKYSKSSLLILIGILLFISFTNLIIDPGEIYLKKIINDYNTSKYVDILENSKYGLIQENWNERSVKISLAQRTKKSDCIVIGSSHVLQISSVRNTGNINNECKDLVNLAVSGGSLEDIFIFSNILLNKKKMPNRVFISIDPWTFKFNMDSRYLSNKIYYNNMLKYLNLFKTDDASYKKKIFLNLINKEYFFKSLRTLINSPKETFTFTKIEKVSSAFDYNIGYNKRVTLSDGSIVYSKSWINEQMLNVKKLPYGGGDYKIVDKVYDDIAIDYFTKLLEVYKRKGINVNFLITPYHPNVFKKGETKTVQHINAVNIKLKEIANKYDMPIFGSYFPHEINCNDNQFFDFMHATTDCLNKIDFLEKNNSKH